MLKRAHLALIGLCCLLPSMGQADSGQNASEEIFNARILPIFRSAKPSSCVQCHLASVDLKNYILPSAEQTFASLRDQGLINLEQPRQSKILKLIEMGAKDEDEGARLIHQATREAEQAAFASWIVASAKDPRMRSLPKLKEAEWAGPSVDDAIIRHARKSRLVESFARNVWSQRMRCFPCHTPNEVDPNNPRHRGAMKKRSEMQEHYGDAIEKLNLFRESPEATLAFWIESSQRRVTAAGSDPTASPPLMDIKQPQQSLILLKPMSKLPARDADGSFALPSNVAPLSHMGGLKLHRNDQSYKSIVAWISDYASVVQGEYQDVEDLPKDNWRPTTRFIRVADMPEGYEVGTTVQLFVYSRDGDKWSGNPVAFTQGTITPRRLVNGSLFLLASGDTTSSTETPESETALPVDGKYQIAIRVDQKDVISKDPTRLLGADSEIGRIEFNAEKWVDGFRTAARLSAEGVTKP